MAINNFSGGFPKAAKRNKNKFAGNTAGLQDTGSTGAARGGLPAAGGSNIKAPKGGLAPVYDAPAAPVDPFNPSAYSDAYAANNQYDPATDPMLGQAHKTGKLELDAGLMALDSLFAEQRKGVEGRSFNQGLSGSGIQEGIWGQQYRQEGSDVGQLAADNAAGVQGNVTDLMNAGNDRYYAGLDAALQQDTNAINLMISNNEITLAEGQQAIDRLIAQNDSRKADAEERKTDAILAGTFFPEGGSDAIEWYDDYTGGGANNNNTGGSFAQNSGLNSSAPTAEGLRQDRAQWDALVPGTSMTYKERFPGNYSEWNKSGKMPTSFGY